MIGPKKRLNKERRGWRRDDLVYYTKLVLRCSTHENRSFSTYTKYEHKNIYTNLDYSKF